MDTNASKAIQTVTDMFATPWAQNLWKAEEYPVLAAASVERLGMALTYINDEHGFDDDDRENALAEFAVSAIGMLAAFYQKQRVWEEVPIKDAAKRYFTGVDPDKCRFGDRRISRIEHLKDEWYLLVETGTGRRSVRSGEDTVEISEYEYPF